MLFSLPRGEYSTWGNLSFMMRSSGVRPSLSRLWELAPCWKINITEFLICLRQRTFLLIKQSCQSYTYIIIIVLKGRRKELFKGGGGPRLN